jgi:hypothetical protein
VNPVRVFRPLRSKTTYTERLEDEVCVYEWTRHEVHALNATAALAATPGITRRLSEVDMPDAPGPGEPDIFMAKRVSTARAWQYGVQESAQ